MLPEECLLQVGLQLGTNCICREMLDPLLILLRITLDNSICQFLLAKLENILLERDTSPIQSLD